ncbi:hypothetical protein TRIATDRAFT_181960, partial [Trichoderma atroviride IMI 206040]
VACLRSLSFEYMDARRENISLAHPRTCDWFFETSQFQQWRHRDNLQNHNGVLWIKGHPGTGKSTLMKHTLMHLEEEFSETHIIAAHFFNARGDSSEQTPLSMLQIQHYQSKPLIILVDALDECEEAHVRDVVGFLEELSIKAIGVGVALYVCLSSRHYPHIRMEKHLQLVVENSSEHNEDIVIYTRDKLTTKDEEIEEELLEKASGVFMWAVLVIKLLNKAYDEGRIEAMHKTLHDVPRDLEQVFEALLIRDNPNKHETIFMLQFVLLAERPLRPEELYFATLAKTSTEKIKPWDQSKITLDDIRRRITNSSRGLIEVRNSEENEVQFIHKSVNDFLTRNKRLQKLDPALKVNGLGSSHECLRSCCMAYLMEDTFQSATDRKQIKALGSSYPFLEYASVYLLAHAEEADKNQVGQAGFLQRLLEEPDTLEKLRLLHNSFEEFPGSGCARGVSLPHIVAFHGYTRLTTALLDKKVNINTQGGALGSTLQAAVFGGDKEIVKLLIEAGADVNAQGGHFGYALQVAASKGDKEIAELLINKGADVNAQGGLYGSALCVAAVVNKGIIVKILLEKGADINAQGGMFGYALHAAAEEGNRKKTELLLRGGADVNARGGPYGSALCVAAAKDDEKIVQILLEAGADVNAQGGPFGNALCAAATEGNNDVIRMLLQKGANVNAQGGPYGNALCAAAIKGETDAVQLLLDEGADVNSKTEIY